MHNSPARCRQALQLIRYYKGQHVLSLTPKVIETHLKESNRAAFYIDPKALHWTPPVPIAKDKKKR